MTQEMIVQVVGVALTALIGLAAAYFRKKMKTESQKELVTQVEKALLQGMAVAQEKIVRPAKKDGKKLDDEQIASAEEMALAIAKDVATKKVKAELNDMSNTAVKSMIKGLLKK
jgi:ribosomal protein L18